MHVTAVTWLVSPCAIVNAMDTAADNFSLEVPPFLLDSTSDRRWGGRNNPGIAETLLQ